MSQRPSSRRSVTNEQSTTQRRCPESNRGEQRRTNNRRNRNIEPIQEECSDTNELQEYEENTFDLPRYDPKEVRDAVKILSPFVRLMEDVNNPYARIVAREVCKTFYRWSYPNKHPVDVMKTINWNEKRTRSAQLWLEFSHYTRGRKDKCWEPMGKIKKLEIEPDGSCNSSQTKNKTPDIVPPDNQCLINLETERDLDAHSNFNEVSHPKEICEHQSAGSDPYPCSHNFEPGVQRKMCSSVQSTEYHKEYTPNLDTKQICDKISDSKRQLEQLVENARKKCFITSEESLEEDEIQNCSKRQPAGDDIYLPYCEPGCSTDPTNYSDDPPQYDYYRAVGDTPSSQRNQVNLSLPLSSIVPAEHTTNALDVCPTNDEYDDSSDSMDSIKSTELKNITCNASMVANAFTNLSLAKKDLDEKKNAFETLTENYLKFVSNPAECAPPCANSPNSKQIIRQINKNLPTISNQLTDDELNTNAFKDIDFIRILPFYDKFHSHLIYISQTQRDYGMNMIEDIMSTLHHIHYELGDPRLKGDLLVEHVKIITRNTWESYFYKGGNRMPAIPEPPLPSCPSSPQNFARQSISRKPCSSRQPSPRLSIPNQPCSSRQPNPNQSCQRAPSLKRPSDSCREQTTESRPRVASRQRPADPPQQVRNPAQQDRNLTQQVRNPPTESRGTFLRRSQPSGAPKGWAPKLKPVERPKDFKEFKAKPLPKFVNQRLRSRDGPC